MVLPWQETARIMRKRNQLREIKSAPSLNMNHCEIRELTQLLAVEPSTAPVNGNLPKHFSFRRLQQQSNNASNAGTIYIF